MKPTTVCRSGDHERPMLRSHTHSSSVQSSWNHRSTKRKFQNDSSVCESRTDNLKGLPPSSKPANQRRPQSLSAPLHVFSDGDPQTMSLSAAHIASDDVAFTVRQSKADILLKDRRHRCSQGLRDATNIGPRNARKQQTCCSVSAEVLALQEALRIERETLALLQAELEEERNAANTAASEAMAMIARLQEEKAAVLMDARQFKRMAEERELHNQEAIALLKEMLLAKEEENLALEHELETCRSMFLALEGGDLHDAKSRYIKAAPESVCDDGVISASEFNNGARLEDAEDDIWRRRRNFNLLISDDIRNDLTNCFEQTECTEKEADDDKNADSTLGASSSADMVVCDLVDDHDSHVNGSSSGASRAPSPDSVGEAVIRRRGTFPPQSNPQQNHNPSTSLLWDRIMNLEHRLELFGIGHHGERSEATVAWQKLSFATSDFVADEASLFDQEPAPAADVTTERPSKFQCIEVARCCIQSSKQTPDLFAARSAECKDSCDKGAFIAPETPCDKDAEVVLEEKTMMHDVYDIIHQSTEKRYSGAPARRWQQSSPELIAPDLELMDVQSYASPPPPPGVSVTEIQRLTSRLQALETERLRMNEAISTLQKENAELKTFQKIAQEFHQLNGLAGYLPGSSKDEAVQPNPSLLSLFTGFLSCVRNGTESKGRNQNAPPSDTGALPAPHDQKHTTGLSYILEKSPELPRTGTVMVRGMKARARNVGWRL